MRLLGKVSRVFKKKSPEQNIIAEAEKVGSMKESLDALSWNRVAEIAKELQNEVSDEDRQEYGRELLAISQANTSLLGKLGISAASLSGQHMPSGIEMLQEDIVVEPFDPEEPTDVQIFRVSETDQTSTGEAVSAGKETTSTPENTDIFEVAIDESIKDKLKNSVSKQKIFSKKKKS